MHIYIYLFTHIFYRIVSTLFKDRKENLWKSLWIDHLDTENICALSLTFWYTKHFVFISRMKNFGQQRCWINKFLDFCLMHLIFRQICCGGKIPQIKDFKWSLPLFKFPQKTLSKIKKNYMNYEDRVKEGVNLRC